MRLKIQPKFLAEMMFAANDEQLAAIKRVVNQSDFTFDSDAALNELGTLKVCTEWRARIMEMFPEFAVAKLNTITLERDSPSTTNMNMIINDEWAGNIYLTEEQGYGYDGKDVTGHMASIFLRGSYSRGCGWYDESGRRISGYLFFKGEKK